MDNKPYDSAFKDLAGEDAEALLRLIGALPPGASVRPLRPEISAPALATDQPYEVITATDHYITHLEAQTRWAANVPDRVVGYEAVFWVNKRLPVHSYVLVFIPDGMPDDPPNRCVIRAGDLTLTSEFTIVKAWELSAEDALAQNNPNLLPFIPLMEGGDQQLVGSLRYNRDSIIQMLGRTTMQLDHILRETPYIQSIISEAREEALEKARKDLREEVRKEVVEEAQHQTVIELLLRAIDKRFPGHDFKAEVERALDTDALKQLVLNLGTGCKF